MSFSFLVLVPRWHREEVGVAGEEGHEHGVLLLEGGQLELREFELKEQYVLYKILQKRGTVPWSS